MHKARHNPYPAFIIAFQIIILDQLTKLWIRLNFELGESIPVLSNLFGDTFRITHAENTGAAFSLSLGSPVVDRFFFIAMAFIATGFIIWLLLQNTHRIQVIAFGMVMGGALGNVIDRILRGGVTDFVDVDFPDFIMHRFPIFNVADSMIFIAMMLLIYEILFIKDSSLLPAKSPDVAEDENTDTNKEI